MSDARARPDPPAADDTTIAEAAILAATRRWVERAVIGLNLCPFARAPFIHGRLHFRISRARDTDDLLADLRDELAALQAADPRVRETTLLIHPHVLTDFYEYNDFLWDADAEVRALGLEGDLQIASFHPDYQFADTVADAVENYTNRSPYPMLHLLRESSIDIAVEAIADADEIYRRNIETLRRLGTDGWRALMRDDSDTTRGEAGS
ncbi:MAG: DUF1415 domain-containing protein [Rhodanobacteraceae bacterium]